MDYANSRKEKQWTILRFYVTLTTFIKNVSFKLHVYTYANLQESNPKYKQTDLVRIIVKTQSHKKTVDKAEVKTDDMVIIYEKMFGLFAEIVVDCRGFHCFPKSQINNSK